MQPRDAAPVTTRLAMFPLGTVLVPHGVMPIHVFEPRYRVLMFDCLRGEREFGVVLIERGSEVGGHDQRFAVATVAQIVEATELPDGRWFVLVVGTSRVDVVEWLADDPYPLALVDQRVELPWPGPEGSGGPGGPGGPGGAAGQLAAGLAAAEQAVRRALALAAEVGEPASSALVELSEDPAVAAWQLLAVAPIGSLDKQRLLAVDDHAERLGMLMEVAEDKAALLAYRLNRE